MNLKSLNPHPDRAYITDNLWLPKSKVRADAIKSALEILLTNNYGGDEQLILWRETDTHLIVPREFIDRREYDKWRFPFIDLTPEHFPRVEYKTNFQARDTIQRQAFLRMLDAPGGILNLSCGLGKTAISLAVIAALGMKTLIMVHTTTLVRQWEERISEFLDFEGGVGIVQQSREEWDRSIIIAMIHTVAQRAGEIPYSVRKDIGVVIYDEIHHLAATVFSKTAPLFLGKRYGLTATENRLDRREPVYFYHVGRVFFSNKSQELTPEIHFFDSGLIVEPKKNRAHKVVADAHFLDANGEYNLMKVRAWLGIQERRNELLRRLIRDCLLNGRRILVVSHSVEQLRILHERIPESGLCIGEVDQDTRYDILQDSRVVLATLQIAQEGVDQPLLDTLIVATPFSSKNTSEQAIGRILRVVEGKKKPKVFFLTDNQVIKIRPVLANLRKGLRTLRLEYKLDKVYNERTTV